MKVFLAGTSGLKKYPEQLLKCKYILESFYSIKEWQIPFLSNAEMFFLDSGAFTFINSKKRKCNFDEYLTRYIDFINKHDIKYFFELDVDNIVGYEKVKQMRKRLEKETGKKCIPVWHKSRGKDEFLKMCDEYDYVAIGGIVTKEITKEQYPLFSWFINEAHKRKCKVHGLGFTSTTFFDKIRFDSVDSTTWLVGGKFGNICAINVSKTGCMKQEYTKGKRCIKQDELMIYNFNEWLKFQRYAEINL
jgi:hypothetical protein